WIVIQQRIDDSQSFNQNWTEYKSGFGNYNKNFWLGLEKMHQLTTSADYRLRFEVLIRGSWYSDEYDHFYIRSELMKYSLNATGYSGDKCDILNSPIDIYIHNGMKFSTPDRDNDLSSGNCAAYYLSGNWFNNCAHQLVNTPYNSTSFLYKSSRITLCRMMMKRNF
ncbi:hypothetical protein HELRODRAFT_81234, partial [Helobdella robusta]|uniref:Fibrinogen C-terminal domain-containing protein n=1 Tax=Helobdella robusta TaxID=6412 RepID=T1G4B9_HELRO